MAKKRAGITAQAKGSKAIKTVEVELKDLTDTTMKIEVKHRKMRNLELGFKGERKLELSQEMVSTYKMTESLSSRAVKEVWA